MRRKKPASAPSCDSTILFSGIRRIALGHQLSLNPADMVDQGNESGEFPGGVEDWRVPDFQPRFDTCRPWVPGVGTVANLVILLVAGIAYTADSAVSADLIPDRDLVPSALTSGDSLADTDADGMPDAWEIQHRLDAQDPNDAYQDANGNGISNRNEYQLGFDPQDRTLPTIASATTPADLNTVIVTFSRPLDPFTATNVAHYAIAPELAVLSAKLKGSNVVILTTADQTPGATAYTLSVNDVKDLQNRAIAADSAVTFYSCTLESSGVLAFSYWGGVSGTMVEALLEDPRYPGAPDRMGSVMSFSSRDYFPDDSEERYGATLSGHVNPLESGNYRFFIQSDDASQLWLSTDETEANLVRIAEETGCCSYFTEPESPRTSRSIALEAGRKYFVRLIYKEAAGGDYGRVAWRKEGDTTPAASLTPIESRYLSSAMEVPVPAEGVYSTRIPAPGASGVHPETEVRIVHADGKSAWTHANVTLAFDGVPVNPTFSKEGRTATIVYRPPFALGSETIHTVTLGYPDPAGNLANQQWSFKTAQYRGPVGDRVAGYRGLVLGHAVQTPNRGGWTGNDGDAAVDLTLQGGLVQILDAAFLASVSAAMAGDELSVSLWLNEYEIVASTAISFFSTNQIYGFRTHVPWSDETIYFDTAGCCWTGLQRQSAPIADFSGYSGDSEWWRYWHHFVFTKKGEHKQIWVDGQLLVEGGSAVPLPTDISRFHIGAEALGVWSIHGLVDDVAVYSKALTSTQIAALQAGTDPLTFEASAGLLGYWDFNDRWIDIVTEPVDQVASVGDVVTFEVEARASRELRYQWLTNGVPIFGATNATLVLPNARLDDAGRYEAVMNNTFQSITSRVATLSVRQNQMLTWIAPTRGSSLAPGQEYPLVATSSSGLPVRFEVESGPAVVNEAVLSVTGPGRLILWAIQDGDAGFAPTRIRRVFNGSEAFALDPVGNVVGDATLSFVDLLSYSVHYDSGRYWLEVESAAPFPSANRMGEDRRLELSWFIDADRNASTGDASDGMDYHVRLGLDKGGWYWRFEKLPSDASWGGLEMSEGDFGFYVAGATACLSFPIQFLPRSTFDFLASSRLSDGPHGASAATNPKGQRATFELESYDVDVAPRITVQPESRTVALGATARLSVEAVGVPAPNYQWYAGTTLLSEGTASTWVINNAQVPDGRSDYFVVVGNDSGSVTSRVVSLSVRSIADEVWLAPVGHFETQVSAQGVTVAANAGLHPGIYAYVAGGSGGLEVVDLANPTQLRRVGNYDTGGTASGIGVFDTTAFVADAANHLQAIGVLDVANPTLEGEFLTGGTVWGVTLAGNHAYLADGAEGLRVVDASNPANLQGLGSFDTPGSARSVAVLGRYAYVADGSGGLRVIDVSNPVEPQSVGFVDAIGEAWAVVVQADWAFVAARQSGLQVIDISDPANPSRIGSFDTSGDALGLALSGRHVYVADGVSGVQVIDISDPAHPRRVGSFDTAGLAQGVAIHGDYAFVADGDVGLVAVEIREGLPQTIAFDPPATLAMNHGPLVLTASANSGLPVTFSLVSGPGMLSGDVLSPTGAGTIRVRARQDGNAQFLPVVSEREIEVQSVVVARFAFYNESAFDGRDIGASPLDDEAIAADKTPLLPGQVATFDNYTSYNKGLNGLMIDVLGASANLTSADFAFRVGNTNNLSEWAVAAVPASVSTRHGAGVGGSDRVTLIWGADAVRKKWIEVTVLSTSNTGLAEPDVFYFGNAPGETGNSDANAFVTSVDALRILQNTSANSTISNRFDINRDGRVASADRLLVLNNLSAVEPLILLDLTGTAASPVLAEGPPLEVHKSPLPTLSRSVYGLRIRWLSDGVPAKVWTTDDAASGVWETLDPEPVLSPLGQRVERILPIDPDEPARFYRLEGPRRR